MATQEAELESVQIVTEYLDTRGAEMHEALAVESRFNRDSLQYETREKQQDFLEKYQAYRELAAAEKIDLDACSWYDVFDRMAEAQDVAAANEERSKAFFTKNRRKITRTLPLVLMPAMSALPDEACLVRVGLSVIFAIAQQREKNRQSVLDAFERLPETILMALSKASNYPDDERLQGAIRELQNTLIDAIPRLVEILKPGTILSKMRNPFKEYDIKTILDQIRRSADKVKGAADHLHDVTITSTHKGVQAVQDTTSATQTHVFRIEEGVTAVHRGVEGLTVHHERLDNRLDEVAQDQQLLYKQIADALLSQNSMFNMLKDQVVKALYEQEFRHTIAYAPVQDFTSTTSRQLQTIQHRLRISPGHDLRDLAATLKESRRTDLQERATSLSATVLRHGHFTRWLDLRTGPALLLVEGRLDSTTLGKSSPLSFLAANLAALFRDGVARAALPLCFFAGAHAASVDPLAGPRGLLLSLLAQLVGALVAAGPPPAGADLRGLATLDAAGGDEAGAAAWLPAEALAHDMCKLARLVPPDATPVVLVDDVPRLGWRDEWARDFDVAMGALERLSAPGGRAKVLLTAPAHCPRLPLALAPHQRIALDGGAGGRRLGAATERAVVTGMAGGMGLGPY